MIAQAGLLAFRMGQRTPVAESTCTQRYVISVQVLFLPTERPDIEPMKFMSRGEYD